MVNLSLKNFEESIDEVILERGLDYYNDDRVDNLQKIEAGLWAAQVMGSENYITSVWTNRTKIKDWECACPYDFGPVCKHVVAVFYAIRDTMELEKVANKQGITSSKKTKKDNVQRILDKISKEELSKFLLEQFVGQKNLKGAFIAKYAEYLDSDINEKYIIIVRNLYKSAQGQHGFVDYQATKRLSKKFNELIKKAKEFYKNANLLESIAICKAHIEEIPTFLNNMDDSDGSPVDIYDSAFELFDHITTKAPPMLKDELFEYVVNEYPKKKYSAISLEDRFLELMPKLITTNEQEKQFFNIIGKQIKHEEDNSFSEGYISYLIKIKTDYLCTVGKEDEADKLLRQYIKLFECRRIIVDKLIKNKQYDKAKKLINEGINTLENNWEHHNIMLYWQSEFLHIAFEQKDIPEVIRWSEHLFFETNFNFDYYFGLKNNYSAKEWSIKRDEIIEKLIDSVNIDKKNNLYPLANVYAVEEMKDRLLKLLSLNPYRLEFIDDFSKYLVEDYKNEILILYEKAIVNHAKEVGRAVYREVVRYLKRMLKIEGSKKQVNKIVSHFRVTYKNRSAMMSIIDESFPRSRNINANEKKDGNQLDLFK